jgi:aryl-alcohol dehydrogenase-like predicted oxidoreductase
MSGLLTERFSRERAANLDPTDWRHGMPAVFAEPGLSRNLALRDAMIPIAERHGTSVAAVAVAWALSWPGVSGAIVGARNAEQVDGWINAYELTLDDADLEAIADAIETTGAGEGPSRPV